MTPPPQEFESGPHAVVAVTPPHGRDSGVRAWLGVTRGHVAEDLARYPIIGPNDASAIVDQIERCDHFFSFAALIGIGLTPREARGFLKRHGYWPKPSSTPTSLAPIRCHSCHQEIVAREACYFDVVDDDCRRYWHARCSS